MKIAIFSDTHIGYPRFEEDSYVQAEKVISDASGKADIILCAGDIFDTKIPKLESLKKAVEIFNKAKVPVFAIHGNHERRAKELVNPVQLLAAGTGIRLLHGDSAVFEKNGERIQILGMGSVPEEYAETALKKSLERFQKEENGFSVLMIHQSIKELMHTNSEEEISLEFLESLPFDLIVNGHIHEVIVKLGGRLIVPGSTVITQLKKEETAPKGYFIYDTINKSSEFVDIDSRKFFYESLEFSKAGEIEIRNALQKMISKIREKDKDALIAIRLEGSLKEGLKWADISIQEYENTYIYNQMDSESLGARLEKIRDSRQEKLSIRELALKELREKTSGKIGFDSTEFFETLLLGSDKALEYIEKQYKKDMIDRDSSDSAGTW